MDEGTIMETRASCPQKEVTMEQKRERGLKQLPDGRWQFSWWHEGRYHRRIVRTKTEARAYLEKVHTQIREGRYMDPRKEAKTTFEEAVKKFLEWSEASTRPSSHGNDKLNAPLWLASPHFKGKKLEKITAGDVEQFRLDRLKALDCRGPSVTGLMRMAGRLYLEKTGRTLKYQNRSEVRSALSVLLTEHSPSQVRRTLQEYFDQTLEPNITRFRTELAAILQKPAFIKKGRAITKRTVDISLARLKRLFTLCVDWGLCSKNPAAKVKLFREDQKRTRYLTLEEEEKLLSVCPPSLHRIVTFALHTGMRRGEILGLRWQDVDLRSGIATIPAAKAKGKRDRYVPLNSVAREIIKNLPRAIDRTAYVFGNAQGNHNDYLRHQWQVAVEDAGLEDFRFHDLRHTFASRLVMAGVDLAALRELLGHRDFEMTLRYAHLSPSHLRSAVAILEPNLRKTCDRPSTKATRLGTRGA